MLWKTVLGAIAGALLFGSTAAATNWTPLIQDKDGHLLVDLDSTKAITQKGLGPIAIVSKFRRLETNDQYDASVSVGDCLYEQGTITIGTDQVEQWSAKSTKTFDLVAQYLCIWAVKTGVIGGE